MEECKYSFFISYSHKDKHLVDSIKEELNKAEITYWVDSKLKVGERHGFTQDIAQAINDSRFVLFVWSQSSNDSSFVSKEIAYAVEKQKNIVTYRIDENIDTTENNAIEFNVGNIHRINAYELGRYEAIKQKLIPELIAMTQSKQLPPPLYTFRQA